MIPLAFGTLGIQELLLILVILVFLFGARKIPDIARGLGEGIRGFRSALRGGEDEAPKQQEGSDEAKPTETRSRTT